MTFSNQRILITKLARHLYFTFLRLKISFNPNSRCSINFELAFILKPSIGRGKTRVSSQVFIYNSRYQRVFTKGIFKSDAFKYVISVKAPLVTLVKPFTFDDFILLPPLPSGVAAAENTKFSDSDNSSQAFTLATIFIFTFCRFLFSWSIVRQFYLSLGAFYPFSVYFSVETFPHLAA